MSGPDNRDSRPSLPADEEAQIDSLFDRLTDASLRPADPGTTAEALGGTLQAPPTPARLSSQPPPLTRSSRPPSKTRSSVPAPNVSLRPSRVVAGVLAGGLAQGQSEIPRDAGADAARRTVRKRAGRRGQLAYVGRGADVVRARAGLMAHLAQRTSGPQAARLWTTTAELHDQLEERDIARALRTRACAPSSIDLIGLRASQRDAEADGDWSRLVELLALEASLPLPWVERSLALTRAAEVALFRQQDADRASDLCEQALNIDNSSVDAALLWSTARRIATDHAGQARAFSALAAAWRDPLGRTNALTLAGRAHEAAAAPTRAFAEYERALREVPAHVDAAWGAMRTARAAGQPVVAATAAANVARALQDPEARSAWLRAAARAAASFATDAPLARGLLAEDNSRLGLRLSARIAASTNDPAAHRIALERWAHAAGGGERAIALVELARLAIDAGNFDAADQALVDAAIADGNFATVRVVRDMLARKRGGPAALADITADDESEVLTAAAKLASDPAQAGQERELLRRGARLGDDALTADVIALDAAASAGDREAVFQGVLRKAARARPEERVAPLLALLDYLPADEWGTRRAEVEHELRVSVPESIVALRQRLRSATDETARAALWRIEANVAEGEHAAFCATMSGNCLAAADQDPTDAYKVATQSTPLYEPAAWALERHARLHQDIPLLLQMQERLAEQGRTPTERAGRLFRAGLLHTSTAPEAAADRLRRALQEQPEDAIATELLLRLSASKPTHELAELLLASTTAAGVDAGHAGRVRAGALLEDAFEWSAAAKQYRMASGSHEQPDPFTALALDRAELLAKEHARVAQRRTEAVRDAQDTPSRMVALSQLAEFERDRGDMQSAVLALQSLREVAPYSVQTMRTLERYYLDHQRGDELNDNVEALIDALVDPADVASYLRLRLALAQEGGSSIEAKDQLLVGRIEQTSGDPWCMRREEAAARRVGDSERRWRAIHEQIPHVSHAMERASLCLRALDTAAAQASLGMAALLASAVESAPEHPIASEELARLHELAGDHASAAAAFETAARASYTTERKVSLWYRAGVLWQDRVNDEARALAALREAATLNLLHRDTFSRLHLLLSTGGDHAALATLIETRIAAGGDASLLSSLHAELSSLRNDMHDRRGAKAGLSAALALDSSNTAGWRALAELQLADEEWTEAADALIQLARLSKDQAELRWAFFTLGDIYEIRLPDLKRAEIALSRVVKLFPDDAEAIERLARVFTAQGQLDMAERALQRLCDLRRSDASAWRTHRIELAKIIEQRGDARRAEKLLEETRREAPLDLSINRALAEHHTRENDESARAMHLSRAVTDYRNAIQTNAANPEAWLGLVDMLDRRGKRDAADLCAQVAYVLDVEAPSLRERKRPAQAAPLLIGTSVDDLIAPDGLTASTRLVLRQLGPVLEKLLATDSRGPGAERAKSRPDAIQRALTTAGAWLGIDRVELYVNRSRSCHVSETNPWTLALGEALISETSDAEKLFLVTRALKLGVSDLSLVVRTDSQLFGGALHGLVRHIDVAYEPTGVDIAVVDEWARRIGKVIPRRLREDLAPNVLEMAGNNHFDPARLGHLCDRFGARAALVASGDFAAAIAALLRESNLTLPVGNAAEAQRSIVRHPVAGDLLMFTLSDACFAAREVALSSTPTALPGATGR